jgi:hypothetical protein
MSISAAAARSCRLRIIGKPREYSHLSSSPAFSLRVVLVAVSQAACGNAYVNAHRLRIARQTGRFCSFASGAANHFANTGVRSAKALRTWQYENCAHSCRRARRNCTLTARASSSFIGIITAPIFSKAFRSALTFETDLILISTRGGVSISSREYSPLARHSHSHAR